MKYYKGTINKALSYVLFSEDDMHGYVKELIAKGDLEDYTTLDKVVYNYNVTVEELKKEYETQMKNLKDKMVEIEEYFASFKGKIIDGRHLKYNLQEFNRIVPFTVATLPMKISSDEDKKKLKEVLSFKPDEDVVYDRPMYLKSCIEENYNTYGDPELTEIEYVINKAIFIGLKECKLQHRALCLAIYNKIGTIFNSSAVYFEDFESLMDGEITMKGFVKKFDITKKKKTSC